MSQFQIVRDGAFRHDQELKAAITAVTAASFIDEVDRLDREIDRCDTLYLLRDEGGDVLCFLMVAWEALDIDGRQEPALYTGLTAARPDLKSTGNAMKLYRFFVSDAQRWEELHRKKLIVWGTMASPIVFFAARSLFANTQPSGDGTYTDEAGRVARAIRRRLGVGLTPGANPLVFHRLAAGVRFLEEERRRIAQVCEAMQFFLFDRLGIDEAEGDRLLYIAEIPPAHRRGVRTTRELTAANDGRSPECPGDPNPWEFLVSNLNAESSRRWFEEVCDSPIGDDRRAPRPGMRRPPGVRGRPRHRRVPGVSTPSSSTPSPIYMCRSRRSWGMGTRSSSDGGRPVVIPEMDSASTPRISR